MPQIWILRLTEPQISDWSISPFASSCPPKETCLPVMQVQDLELMIKFPSPTPFGHLDLNLPNGIFLSQQYGSLLKHSISVPFKDYDQT